MSRKFPKTCYIKKNHNSNYFKLALRNMIPADMKKSLKGLTVEGRTLSTKVVCLTKILQE